jgi:hypothetical protein
MKWIKRLLLNWVKDAQRDQLHESCYENKGMALTEDVASSEDDDIEMGKAVRFAVLPARGGCVLEIKSWDKKEHEWETITHVIPEGQDVAHAVGQLVSMEMLRR